MAGKRKGTDDERYLWGEMLRAIQEIKPQFVIAENVFGITNIDGGLVFEQVCLDLEAEGYEVQPFIIPAAAKNAPHRRDRVWFIAQNTMFSGRLHGKSEQERAEVWEQRNTCTRSSERIHLSEGNATDTNCRGLEGTKKIRRDSINVERKSESRIITNTMSLRLQQCKDGAEMGRGQKEICGEGSQFTNGFKTNGKISNATDTCYKRLQGNKFNRTFKGGKWKQNDSRESATQLHQTKNWEQFPTESPICSGDDGLPTELDGITFSKWRAESIKGYGNAIVPQIAYEIFKQLWTTDTNTSN
jgi:DNA (cytosine-5)-methyltransferase 1